MDESKNDFDFLQLEGFDWDKGNIEKNLIKHKVHYKECEEVFTNEHLNIYPNEKHSKVEKRYAAFGKTDQGRKLTVIFTIRNNKIRPISARGQSKKERREYEKKEKN